MIDLPSRFSHVIVGGGDPSARHPSTVPALDEKTTLEGGTTVNLGPDIATPNENCTEIEDYMN